MNITIEDLNNSAAAAKAAKLHPPVVALEFGLYEVCGSDAARYTVKICTEDNAIRIDCNCLASKYGNACYHASAALNVHCLIIENALDWDIEPAAWLRQSNAQQKPLEPAATAEDTQSRKRAAWIGDIEMLYDPFCSEYEDTREAGKPMLFDAIEQAGGLKALPDCVLEILARNMLARDNAGW